MIRKYTFGTGIRTDAVTVPIPSSEGPVPYLEGNADHTQYRYPLSDADAVYGLGEAVRGINKRGWRYRSFCRDEANHLETTEAMYGAHNFLVVKGEQTFGLFFDYPGSIVYDVGCEKYDRMTITLPEPDYDLYVIDGASAREIIRQFRHMIGRSYIPPRWAFGYGQSRWGYKTAEDVREVIRMFDQNEMPLDSIYLDIDYMERYKDFTVDGAAFPDMEGLVKECGEQGIHLVPIIDAGIRIEKGYPVYEEGVAGGFFCKDAEGKDFIGAVWPGKVHFPDVLNREAAEWFGSRYAALLSLGIDGFWNDMNEPSIFYTEKRLEKTLRGISRYAGRELSLQEFWDILGSVSRLGGNEEDYENMYHNIGGEMVRHDKVHNLYGSYLTRAAADFFRKWDPDRRFLLFSRASCIGMHRYGGVWMGDNKSWWSHILLNLQMLPSLNMCGFLFTGADIGGYGEDATEDLVLRWMELGIFTPLMRNHSALDTRRQEPYQFGRKDAFRRITELRYAFLPYLYSEYVKAAVNDDMLFVPLGLEYEGDPRAAQAEDQMLVGESIMIAPVYRQNAQGRYVYLPERMKLVLFRGASEYKETMLEKGDHYIPIAPDEVAVFIRQGHILPLAPGGRRVSEVDCRALTLLVCEGSEDARYTLYWDDGYETDVENPDHSTVLSVRAEQQPGQER